MNGDSERMNERMNGNEGLACRMMNTKDTFANSYKSSLPTQVGHTHIINPVIRSDTLVYPRATAHALLILGREAKGAAS